MTPQTLALLAQASARIDSHTSEIRERCSESTLLQFQALKRDIDSQISDFVNANPGAVPAVAVKPAAKKTARRGR